MRYLDPSCDAIPPADHTVIEAERDFLEHAFDTDIVVRGANLCAWATSFWDARGIAYEALQSPIRKLRIYSPEITDAEAKQLLKGISSAELKILGATDLRGLLNGLFPADIWRGISSLHHAAHWLLWLYEAKPPAFAQPLLRAQAVLWQQQLPGGERNCYDATNAEQAQALLDQWLGISQDPGLIAELPEFPLSIPEKLRERVENSCTRRIIESRGLYYRSMLSRRVPFELKEQVATITAEFFRTHPAELSNSIIEDLCDFLSMSEIAALREIVPPAMPPLPPTDPSLIPNWFCNLYLPYRLWSVGREGDAIRAACRERGTAFAKWFLEFYPKALATGAETIGFRRCGRVMQDRSGKVTLLVILDGIGIGDARDLIRYLNVRQRRLTLTKNDWCFAAIPTVTEICKPALRQGVAPRNVNPNTYALASDSIRLFENQDAAEILRSAQANHIYIWSMIQTDEIYHKVGDAETVRANISNLLDGLAKRIASAVEAVPNQHKLSVIVTTDHGRFLGRSDRTIALRSGMVSHQRAAWGGDCSAEDLTKDFAISADGKAALLHPERYGLLQAAMVAIGEDSFLNNDGTGGADLFPHGGVWPEEVIVPWLEFQRDATPPQIDGTITGTGVEGREGTVELQFTNSSAVELEILSVLMAGDAWEYSLEANRKVPPKDALAFSCRLNPWPSASKIRRLTAKCVVRQPTGDKFVVNLGIHLTSQSFQKRDELLDDLS